MTSLIFSLLLSLQAADPVRIKFLCCFGVLTSPTLASRFQTTIAKSEFSSESFSVSSGEGMELGHDVPSEQHVMRVLLNNDYVIVALEDEKILDQYRKVARNLRKRTGSQHPIVFSAKEAIALSSTREFDGFLRKVSDDYGDRLRLKTPSSLSCVSILSKVWSTMESMIQSQPSRRKIDPFR